MNALVLDKKQIERQFERAAKSYDDAAQLQRDIVDTLAELLYEPCKQASSIADLGCGTGSGLDALSEIFPTSSLIGVDISQAMLEKAEQACPRACYLKADMEDLPIADKQFDLVFTSSSLQWCDLNSSLEEIARVLRPNGFLALATFGPKTQIEWRTAWADADQQQHTLDYPDLAEITATLQKKNIQPLKCTRETRTLRFGTTQEVLRSVKLLGATNANVDRHRGLMGKNRFQRFLTAFEKASPNRSLSYEIFYVIGQKTAL